MLTLIHTYLTPSDELLADLEEEYRIVDDRIGGLLERSVDSGFGKEAVSIMPVEVERAVKRSHRLLP